MTPALQTEVAKAPEVPGLDVKEEPPVVKHPPHIVEEIDLVTSDSETSTSGDDFVESEAEDERELEPAGHNVLNEDYNDAWVQHKKTKSIHAISDIEHQVSDSVYANGELVQGKATRCGRLTSSNFTVVKEIADWTSKCRLCFKGNRDPRAKQR